MCYNAHVKRKAPNARRLDPKTRAVVEELPARAELVETTPVDARDVEHIDPAKARLFALQLLGSMVADAGGILRREMSGAPMPRGLKGAPKRAQWVIETLLKHTDSVDQAAQIQQLGELLRADPAELAERRMQLQAHVRRLRAAD